MRNEATLACALLLAAATRPPRGDGVPFEDPGKHVTLVAPAGYLFDPASNADELAFNGPTSGGVKTRLAVRTLLDGQPLDQLLPRFVHEQLGLDAATNPQTVEVPAGSGFASAVTFAQKLGGKPGRRLVAGLRHGPYALFVTFDEPDADFARRQPVLLAALANVQPLPLRPLFSDAGLGIASYEIPKGFEIEAKDTVAGTRVVWYYHDGNGDRRGDVSIRVSGAPVDDKRLAEWLTERKQQIERRPIARAVKELPIVWSGGRGAFYEAVVQLEGGKLLNTHWYGYMQDSRHMLEIVVAAETSQFEHELRPLFERLLRAVTFEAAETTPGNE